MIVARTKLKKIPDRCLKCKFCVHADFGFGRWRKHPYSYRKCSLTGAQVPYVYNKQKRNWEYTKCKTCPLMDISL